MAGIPEGKVPPMDVFSFNLNYFRNAVRKTDVKSRRDVLQMTKERNRLTPQIAGNYSKRVNLEAQLNKTMQQRFIDMFS